MFRDDTINDLFEIELELLDKVDVEVCMINNS